MTRISLPGLRGVRKQWRVRLTLDGCWLWRGPSAPGQHGAYPVTSHPEKSGRRESAWRAAYRRWVGPIPEGYHVHHTCHNRYCINPAHLEALDPAEHLARHRGPYGKDRHAA